MGNVAYVGVVWQLCEALMRDGGPDAVEPSDGVMVIVEIR